MKIKQTEFIISAVGPQQYPTDQLPEVALTGRSNVGKSSLINKMLLRRKLARTSSQPGKTQTLNYYRINTELYFVDFPGYGYARVSKKEREVWGKMIESYLLKRKTLKLVLQLLDMRHVPSKEDILMYNWLSHYDIPTVLVATKADKIARAQWTKYRNKIQESLAVRTHQPLIYFSSQTGQGRDELWRIIVSEAKLANNQSSIF